MAKLDANQQVEVATTADPAPTLPDYVVSPDAVLGDEGVEWRYGKPPDYSNTRKVWEKTKRMNHAAGSLPQLVENLVKNWEIEASFKPRLQDWRTIDHQNYTFAMNGGPPQTAEHMLKVGTYNAIIAANEYYSPEHSDFAASHETFKHMMPTFAWEVIEVYGSPPTVAFKWRHWGEMKNDYVAFNDKGEKVTARPHGGPIEIFGVTVATVDDNLRVQSIDTWMDPLEMFRQIAPSGIVNKEVITDKAENGETHENTNENYRSKIHPEFSHSVGKDDTQGSTEALAHPVNGSFEQTKSAHPTASGICPFGAHSTRHNEMTDNQPEVGPSNPQKLQLGATEGQVFEAATLPDESLQVRSVFQTARQDPLRKGEEVEQVYAEGSTFPHIESGNGPHHGAEDSGTKRPKLNVEAQEVHDQTAATVSDSVNAALQQPQDAASSVYPSNIETNVNSAEAMDSVSQHMFNGKVEMLLHEEHPHPQGMEDAVMPDAGEAVAASIDSQETQQTYEEMSSLTPAEFASLMNQE